MQKPKSEQVRLGSGGRYEQVQRELVIVVVVVDGHNERSVYHVDGQRFRWSFLKQQ